jgi:hypothetical protein
MTTTQLLIQNLSELLSASTVLKGGQIMNNSSNKSSVLIYSFILILIALIIKGFIVYILYNYLVPKLIYSLSSSVKPTSFEYIENNFKNLTFGESILLVIFFNTLFSF